MKKWLTLLCWPLLLAAESPPETWDLERLMQSLATVGTVDARFEETKRLAVLEEPLVTAGKLYYRAPDYLKKHTLEPYEEIFEVNGDRVTTFHPMEGERRLSLDAHPALRALVESFRATLGGDLQSLRRHYRVGFQGTAQDWLLRLEPKDPKMADYVEAVVVRGRETRVASIETLETNGDRSLLTVDVIQEHSR